MSKNPTLPAALALRPSTGGSLPSLVTHAGRRAEEKFVEFFTAGIRNKNTRLSYLHAVRQFFTWFEHRGLRLNGFTNSCYGRPSTSFG